MAPAAPKFNEKKFFEKLGIARTRALQEQPYLAVAIHRLRPVISPGLGTVACDEGWRLYIDPDTFMSWSHPDAAGALLHEAWHCLRLHHLRGKGQEWNIAQDLEINDDLPNKHQPGKSAKLPDFALVPGHDDYSHVPDGLTAEEYHALLRKNPPKPKPGQSGGQGQGQPGQGQPGVCQGSCGGCAGNPSPGEAQAKANAKAAGELPDGVTEVEAAVAKVSVAEAIKAHERKAGRGSVPAGIARWAEAALGPEKIPWTRKLKVAVRNALATIAGQVDFTYSKMSRRDSGDFIFPALQAPAPEVCVVIDTSGSVSDSMLSDYLREIRGVIRATGVKGVKVLACDSAVAPVGRAFNPKQVAKLLRGGGGTDMGAALEAASKLKPRPDLTLVFTDGDTPWPAEKPKCGRVIVAKFGGSTCPAPTWAREIEVDNA